MRPSRSVINSILTIVILIVLLVTATLAWTSYSGLADGGYVSAGGITYLTNGEMVENDVIINPHKELVLEDISVDNLSSVNTQLRLKIEYTLIEDGITMQKLYQNDLEDDLVVHFASNFIYDSIDGYWYYISKTSSLSARSGPMSIISSMYYDGFKASNEYTNVPINISILLQAKQTDNVTWEELGSYDFTTGQPTT